MDRSAGRWLISRSFQPMPDGKVPFCIAISRKPDPVAGGWLLYDFALPVSRTEPPLEVSGDAYRLSGEAGGKRVRIIFDRNAMLAGKPAVFTVSSDSDVATPPSFSLRSSPMRHPHLRRAITMGAVLLGSSGSVYAQTAPAQTMQLKIDGPIVREPVAAKVFTGDLRRVAKTRLWRAGDPVREVPDLKQTPGRAGAAPSTANREEVFAPPAGPVTPMAASPLTFDGIPATGVAPPNTVGDVGPKHYIQMVNISFAIYDKSGSLLAGPSPINALWAGFGGPCEANNNGDPIVRYDQLADRWVLTQFAFFAGRECIAVSRTWMPLRAAGICMSFRPRALPTIPKSASGPTATTWAPSVVSRAEGWTCSRSTGSRC